MINLQSRIDPVEYRKFTTQGFFTVRRTDKYWAGNWSDQTIEQTLMRTMKSSGGLTRGRGITQSVLTRWTLGMIHLQSICHEVENYCGIISTTSDQHVDMRPSRVTRDNCDVEKLTQWLHQHYPFPENDLLISISSGFVGTDKVNCHQAELVGQKGISRIVGNNYANVAFKRSDKVITLASVANCAKIGKESVTVDPLTLFHRICIAKKSDEDLKNFFAFELAPFPMSLFNEAGMRKGTKSSFYSAFDPTTFDKIQGANNFVVVDGGHLLHKVVWSRNINFKSIGEGYVKYLRSHYGENVSVVFDGYPSDSNTSTKNAERLRRTTTLSSCEVVFNDLTVLQVPQDKFLANEKNKLKFIDFLKNILERANISVKLAVEDADVLIVQTAIAISIEGNFDNIFIVGEDIDLLVLLTGLAPGRENLYFRKCGKGKVPDMLYSTECFKYNFPQAVFFLHAFSGCDTTSALFGQGKAKFCTLLKNHPQLENAINVFSNPEATADQVANVGEKCLIYLYGGDPNKINLNELRYRLFTKSAAKVKSNLARLPPTIDASRFHSLRCYHQVQKWLGIEHNPIQYGWIRTTHGLSPQKMEQNAAPESVLKVISCSCKKGCTNACGCRKAGLTCSTLCTSCMGQSCENVPEIEENAEDDGDGIPNMLENICDDLETQGLDHSDLDPTTIPLQYEPVRPGPSKKPRI